MADGLVVQRKPGNSGVRKGAEFKEIAAEKKDREGDETYQVPASNIQDPKVTIHGVHTLMFKVHALSSESRMPAIRASRVDEQRAEN